MMKFKREAALDDEDTSAAKPWKVLIADDDKAIHAVTKLALGGTEFHGRPLAWIDAYSGDEAVSLMREHPDVALVLMDVVMESDGAGLQAAQRIREELDNRLVRIAVRTGQPGGARQETVVQHYGIDDYREKTDLTAARLFTLVHTSLAHYDQLRLLEETRTGLHRVLEATTALFRLQTVAALGDGLVYHFAALLNGPDAPPGTFTGVAAHQPADRPPCVIAATSDQAVHVGQPLEALPDAAARRRLAEALQLQAGNFDSHYYSAHFRTQDGEELAIHIGTMRPLAPANIALAALFCRNLTASLENRHLLREKDRLSSDMVLTLSEAIGARSLETGNHVRRVAEYARLLGQLAGLDAQHTQLLFLAAPLHDAGKIGIPDAVLNKPGAHTAEESEIMRSHTELGRRIFDRPGSPVLEAAAIVASQHHERWDGQGYPIGLRGDAIHVYGRITALADVFDALTHPRCYKDAWPLHRALEYIVEQSGRRFDPALVELFTQHLDQFLEIHERLRDPTGAVH
jgi:response regulator RpfG family c-di-GMP phosphodiesterase